MMEKKLTLLVHPRMTQFLKTSVQMLSDGLREISIEPELIHELPPEFTGRAIVLGANFFSASALCALPYNSVIFNIENSDANFITSDYISLLRKYHVWDYNRSNAEALSQKISRPVHHLRMFYVESLSRIPDVAEQDIDVLFFGSFNARRETVLDALRARGLIVTAVFGVFGAQLDGLIARSKVVLNLHFYENGRLEMIRLFDLLANRRTIVTELNPSEVMDGDLADAFVAVPYEQLVEATEALVHDAKRRRQVAIAGLTAFSRRRASTLLRQGIASSEAPMLSSTAVIGSGKNYDPNILNIDIDERWHPDVVADISDHRLFEREVSSERFATIKFQRGWFDCIIASHVLEHLPDLVGAMTNCLDLLTDGGIFRITVPYDLSYGAWQDPTHVHAFNERSWLYYCEWYWYLGWTEARFDLMQLDYGFSPLGDSLKAQGATAEEITRTPRAVDEMRVLLRKRLLTAEERAEGERWRGIGRGAGA